MRTITRIYLIVSILFGLVIPKTQGQEITIKIGERDSIQSIILNETRNFIVHLPDNYDESKSYPILFRLDGDSELLFETVATVNRLVYSDEIAPEMIIVAIENTFRARDMWPVNNDYYPEPNIAGAESFRKFLESELLPYIDSKFQTDNRILCGQSLSAVFVVYSLLTKPNLFNSYIGSSAGFPACEQYFIEIRNKSFEQIDNFLGQKIFITNGLLDPLDPDGSIHKQLVDFSSSINDKLAQRIYYKHLTYENEGHVPFHSLYDGLKFIFESNIEK